MRNGNPMQQGKLVGMVKQFSNSSVSNHYCWTQTAASNQSTGMVPKPHP